MLILIIVLVVFLGLFLNYKEQPEPPKNLLDEIKSTDIGYYKVEAAKRQARRIGVGVLIHNGKIYAVTTKNSPREGTPEFKRAYNAALEEKRGSLKSHK